MKKFRLAYLPLILLSVFFTSCIDIVENMVVNKNGTGKYSFTMDMSKLMGNPMLKGMMEASSEEKMEDKDSTFFLGSLPDSVIGNNKEFWNRVSMRTVSHLKNDELFVRISLDFENVSEITYLVQNLNRVMASTKVNPLGSGDNAGGSSSGFLFETLKFTFSKKELSRSSENSNALNEEKEEDMEMLKTFMESAEYRCYYEVPGKIKGTSIPGAKIDGNKLSVIVPLLDVMNNKVSLNGNIKYK